MKHYVDYALTYPAAWEEQYKSVGHVPCWRERFPDQFAEWMGSTQQRPSGDWTLDLFPQYALMYLLRDQQNIRSITWYELSDTSKTSKNRARRDRYWATMREFMGDQAFSILRERTRGIPGEPDLFCWDLVTRQWFFAEAKGKDKLSDSQREWFQLCHECLGDSVDIRVYRLTKA